MWAAIRAEILKGDTMRILTILLASAIFSTSAMATQTAILCEAEGKATSNGGGSMLETDVKLYLTELGKDRDGVRTITDVKGTIKVGGMDEKPPLTEDNAYIGYFRFTKLVKENPNYRPTKYKGFSQFEKFNAYETKGQEDGMWGSFLLEKNTRKASFKAKYIFQAGDHMGGTIHMDCHKE